LTVARRRQGEPVVSVFTTDLLFGMNLITLVGFVTMGVGLSQGRQGRARAPLAFALMGIGTALVFVGLYAGRLVS
jgi:hypothetical protein